MKRYVFFIGLMMLVGMSVIGQNISEGEMEEVARFRIGDGPNEIGYDFVLEQVESAYEPYWPDVVISDDELLIYDCVNLRVLKVRDDFTLEEWMKLPEDVRIVPWRAYYDEEYAPGVLVLYEAFNGIELVERDGEERYVASHEFWELRSFVYYGGVLFIRDAKGRLWSVPDPDEDMEANLRKVLDEEGTRRYVDERWGDSGEVRIDEEGRLLIKGELATRDYTTWLEYRTGKKIEVIWGNRYLGKDKDGNVYWAGTFSVVVYPPEREKGITRILRLDLSKTLGSVAVDGQTGDLYVLGKPEGDEIPLYRIRRDW